MIKKTYKILSKTCKAEGCKWPRFSNGYCKSHQYLRNDAKAEKRKAQVKEDSELSKRQDAEFQKFYNQHPTKRCFECNAYIPVCRKYSVHHCLPKQTYDDIRFDWRYWVLECFRCHQVVETNIDFAPKTKAHTEELLKLYESESKS